MCAAPSLLGVRPVRSPLEVHLHAIVPLTRGGPCGDGRCHRGGCFRQETRFRRDSRFSRGSCGNDRRKRGSAMRRCLGDGLIERIGVAWLRVGSPPTIEQERAENPKEHEAGLEIAVVDIAKRSEVLSPRRRGHFLFRRGVRRHLDPLAISFALTNVPVSRLRDPRALARLLGHFKSVRVADAGHAVAHGSATRQRRFLINVADRQPRIYQRLPVHTLTRSVPRSGLPH
mmetsp:Transcript_105881/g.236196  ORF Transcript_105881/g.236196 Transcript_105881/m.236196 type:complete len:229 (-) Transcript_105881:138-824(-)